ncbi:PREDICTED: trypsin-1-like [Priapulus caudatus]|uniref:Trypsin-1-like n=1 Tax=Priapulus caudatus TaxID=37621 RepID=A0ABM1DS84_PRICU|nr:PREDICTED: trypsin-1-like [Priapulus caudatus]
MATPTRRYESSPRRFQIRVGSTRHYSGTRHQVSEVNKHGSYRPRTFDFDIATMILSTPVSLNAKTQLVEMASGGNQYDGRTATVSGWGTTSEGGNTSPELRCVDVPIVTNSACNAAYGSITSNMLCAGYDAGGKDACQGDSGGPLVINHSCNSMSTDADGDPLLVGVVSWGYGCAAAQYPGVYARVSALRGWVDSNMH